MQRITIHNNLTAKISPIESIAAAMEAVATSIALNEPNCTIVNLCSGTAGARVAFSKGAKGSDGNISITISELDDDGYMRVQSER